MRWKLKAAIHNSVAVLPASVSYPAQFWIQRRFGGLRRVNPVERLSAGIETWSRLRALGHDPLGRVFMEIGTGRVPLVPLAYWLMGAGRTITVDLNPYLKPELVEESLRYIAGHRPEIVELFGPLLDEGRLEALISMCGRAFSQEDFLEACGIDYIAPGDAAATGLPARSIDFHTSFAVLEHIPRDVLARILEEGGRIIRPDGVFIHRIDYSDHFSHSDRTISSINFLQFSDAEWDGYAGNRYMYVNRLRHDDYLALFRGAGHAFLSVEARTDPDAQELLARRGLRLDARFASKPDDVLAIKGAWIASRLPG